MNADNKEFLLLIVPLIFMLIALWVVLIRVDFVIVEQDEFVEDLVCPDTGFIQRPTIAEQTGIGINPDSIAYAKGLR